METCDHCGPYSRAKAKFGLGEFILTYCQHHINMYGENLEQKGWQKTVLETESVL